MAEQIYQTAIEPLPILLLCSIVVGAAMMRGLDLIMRPNAIVALLPATVVYAITCEFIPILVAIVLILRSGTRMAAEIGIQRAWDASKESLMLPQITGGIASAIGLTSCMTAAALIGGYLALEMLDIVPSGLDLQALLVELSPRTIAFALGKAVLFGAVVSAINCFHGRSAGPSLESVPRAIARGALYCAASCLLLNAAIWLCPLS